METNKQNYIETKIHLLDWFHTNHDLILINSELDDIVQEVKKLIEAENKVTNFMHKSNSRLGRHWETNYEKGS